MEGPYDGDSGGPEATSGRKKKKCPSAKGKKKNVKSGSGEHRGTETAQKGIGEKQLLRKQSSQLKQKTREGGVEANNVLIKGGGVRDSGKGGGERRSTSWGLHQPLRGGVPKHGGAFAEKEIREQREEN